MSHIVSKVLPCGASLVVEEIDAVRSLALSIFLPCSNASDPSDRLGRAAMWSELLLRGAGHRDSRALADAFDHLGASRSVSSGRIHMRLGSTMLGDQIEQVVPLLTDMLLRPRFDEDAIEPSRQLCLQSLESLNDDPQERAVLSARARHFPAPFNRSGYGDPAGLNALTRDELIDGWASSARPKGAVISLAGAVDAVRAEDLFAEATSKWGGECTEPVAQGEAERGYGHAEDDSNQVQIVLVHDAPPERDQHSICERLLVGVLSGGMSGRLFTEVREKRGLCYAVSASYRAERDFGSVSSYVGTTPERAQEALDVLHAELVRIGSPEGAITPDEFERAVTGLKSRVVFSGESTGARAGTLGSDVLRLGRPRSLEELTNAIDEVTLDRLNAYAASRDLGRLTIQTLGPEPLTPPAGV